MPDIDLVIKIDEKYFNDIKECVKEGYIDYEPWVKIANGKPLPKGHGALKDVDNIKTAFPSGEYVRTESVRATIDHEDTVIEADKAESEE